MKALFVGSNPNMAERLSVAVRLRWPSAEVLVANEPGEGLKVAEQEQPDVVMFQSASEGRTDTAFISDLRAFSDVPLVVLQPKGSEGVIDEVKALEAGADEYISESVGGINLIARLVALTRRSRRTFEGQSRTLSSGPLTVDPASYEVFLHGSRLVLTPTEFRLLYLLLNNRGNVLTREFIARSIWGDQVDSSALVKKYIQRLRRRLNDTSRDPKWIINVHGVGYKLAALEESESEKTDAGFSKSA